MGITMLKNSFRPKADFVFIAYGINVTVFLIEDSFCFN